jgi:GNAT superfamily N-acetyltransferase
VKVEVVRGRSDRALFVRFPWQLYSGDPAWVPPLRSSVRALLDETRHPFYDGGKGAEIELFLARDGGEVLGRVAAILNHANNRANDENIAFFGFFESVERPDVARELLAAVEDWAGSRGLDAVRGLMTHNPPYYAQLIEGAGYGKKEDLYAYLSPVHGASLDRLERLAQRTRRRNPGLVTREADLKGFAAEVRLVKEVYNAAWGDNWGFVPMSDAEIDWLAKELKPLVLPGLTRFAIVDGEAVGFLLCVPDWNVVLADLDGSPFRHPLRTLKHVLFTRAEKLEGLRLILLGVKPGFRDRGIEGVLLGEGLRVAIDTGYKWCEYSWILEDNELTKRLVRLMGGDLDKVYRIYEKRLSP